MGCQFLRAWSRTIRHVAHRLYVCLNAHLCKLVIVLVVLNALHYLITTITENVTGDTKNSCFILTLNAVDSASSFVFNISVSSVNSTTTTPSLTAPFGGKSLCPPIPPNLSKYYESLKFTFLILLVVGAYSGL